MPLLPQKCCSPAILVVGLFGSLDFTSAETGDAPWLVARVAAVNEAAARAADTPMASVRLMPYLLEQPSHPTVSRYTARLKGTAICKQAFLTHIRESASRAAGTGA